MIIDESNVNKEEKLFGICKIAEMPFVSYRDPEDDQVYVYYEDSFVILDEDIGTVVEEEMTFDEAISKAVELRQKCFNNNDDDEEGDQYHTISIDPNDADDEEESSESIDNSISDEYKYFSTSLVNKFNYIIKVDSLTQDDCDTLMEVRKSIVKMANDWYDEDKVVDSFNMWSQLNNIFELNHITIDLSKYNAEENIQKKLDIMLFNALSYIDNMIIAIQHKMLDDGPITNSDDPVEEDD